MMRSHSFAVCGTTVLSLLLSGCASTPPVPQAQDQSPAGGVLVMAHGGDAAWNQTIEDAVVPLRARWPVEIAYGMAVTSAIEQGVERLEAQGVAEIAVVRLFVSGDSWIEETEYILGLRPDLAQEKIDAHANMPHGGGHGGHAMEAPRPIRKKAARVLLSRQGVGESPLVDQILIDRVKGLSKKPSEETVLLLAHGPGDDAENERWLEQMRGRLAPLKNIGNFRNVHVQTLREDWPDKRVEAEKRIRAIASEANQDGGRLLVVPFRISGFGPYRSVLAGVEYVSDGLGFLPHANIGRWIEETASELFTPRG